METTRKSGKMLVLGLLIIAAACLSCKQATASGVLKDIVLYTAEQVGGEFGVASSTGIELTFESEIFDLDKDQITIKGSITRGSFSGNGKVWTIGLSDVAAEGEVIVSIENESIEKTPKKVLVYKVDEITGEFFKFTVRTTTPNENFLIPTSGFLNGLLTPKPYDWNINWGDGVIENQNGSSSDISDGILHIYPTAGNHSIIITPNGNTDAWFGAFGFSSAFSSRPSDQDNKNKIISVDSELTLLMTRTHNQIDSGEAPINEWNYVFYECKNPDFKMGPNFKFAAEWNTITRVGDDFVNNMFSGCNGAAFTMNNVFNLPQGITNVGKFFAFDMFRNCNGAAFTMNNVFNLPPLVVTSGESFAISMFYGCSGAAFTMNGIFDFPQDIVTSEYDFAVSLFQGCNGAGFEVNGKIKVPVGVTGDGSFGEAFNLGDGAALQTRYAADIISGVTAPRDSYGAFGPSDAWIDYATIDNGWK